MQLSLQKGFLSGMGLTSIGWYKVSSYTQYVHEVVSGIEYCRSGVGCTFVVKWV